MKTLLNILILSTTIIACAESNLKLTNCSTPATVRDLTGLDGCGWVFELSDGSRIEPQRLMFCGTPPLPTEVTEDPLYDFEWVDGKTVYISYEETDMVSICMVGSIVRITCISNRIIETEE